MSNTVLATTRSHGLLCLALLVLLGFSLGCSEFSVIGIEVELAHDFGVSLSEVGQLISLFALAYAVMTPILTLATGRFKRYTLLVAYSVMFVLANLMAVLATSFGFLLLSRVILGCVSGTLIAVGITYIPELVSMKKVSLAISIVYAAFSMAMVVSTSLGKFMASTIGWHYVMIASLVLSLLVCPALLLVMPRSGATDVTATAKEQARLFLEPSIIFGMLIFTFGVGSLYVFYGYVTPYLQQVLGMDDMHASATLMAYGAVCLVSNLLGGLVDTRFGMKALPILFPFIAAMLLGLMLAGNQLMFALGFIFGLALLMYSFSVACISLFMRVARTKHPKALTLASSLEPFSFNMGMSFGAVIGGLVVAGPGLPYVGGVGAILAMLAGAMSLITIYFGKKTLPEQD
ncbi:MAG: MFS transporter [Coriobacteriia bacterium]|nr:MFS transporter [Coriobacteriia bacterium]